MTLIRNCSFGYQIHNAFIKKTSNKLLPIQFSLTLIITSILISSPNTQELLNLPMHWGLLSNITVAF